MRDTSGITLLELAMWLGLCTLGVGVVAPVIVDAVEALRVHGAATDLYAAVHLTRERARTAGVMHALVIEPDGRRFRVVADPAGQARTVDGPHTLPDGATAEANVVIRFSPKGFAVPAGSITVQSGAERCRLIVNLLGRVRVARSG